MKTLKLIDKYFRIIEQVEQPLDATEPNAAPQPDQAAAPKAPEPEKEVIPLTTEGEKYLIDLLVKAFAHTPDNNELAIVDEMQQEYRNTNPKEIASTIQRLLDGGKEELTSELDKVPNL